mmetsp:Transcript_116490/g.336492  ORF Transcript_116490/g.336492 Transcript_116490/m.336492 type:complete len:283 (+) Transcript_116490:542-1390(+)
MRIAGWSFTEFTASTTDPGEAPPYWYTPFTTQMPCAHNLSNTLRSVSALYVRIAFTPACFKIRTSRSTKVEKSTCRCPLPTGFHATPFKCTGLPPTNNWRPLTRIDPPADLGSSGASAPAAHLCALGLWHLHNMSDVCSIGTLQEPTYFTSQLSATSSKAATQTCPKLSQYLSHRPPNGAVCTKAVHASHATPLSTWGHASYDLQHSPSVVLKVARCCKLVFRCNIAGGALRGTASQASSEPRGALALQVPVAASAAPERSEAAATAAKVKRAIVEISAKRR